MYTVLCAHDIYTENQPIEMYSGLLSASEIRAAAPMCYEVIVIIGFKPESLITYQRLCHTATTSSRRCERIFIEII